MSVRRWVVAGSVMGMMLGAAVPAVARPPLDPYPTITRYTKLDWMGFQVEGNPGVWFSTPAGLNCGIWTNGSFGCNGNIPGAPAGTNQIAWFDEDGTDGVHFDSTDQPSFIAGAPQKLLPPNSFVVFRGVRCAVTPESSVFCRNSYLHDFMVTPTQTVIEAQVHG